MVADASEDDDDNDSNSNVAVIAADTVALRMDFKSLIRSSSSCTDLTSYLKTDFSSG